MDEDHILIDQILEGDKALYNKLVVKHQNYAYTIAYNILGNKEDAEEAAHDAFVKAFKNLSRFNQSAKFTTWFYRIVFNTSISAKRKQKHQMRELADNYDFGESSPFLEKKDQKKFINEALLKLNDEDRVALTLFYLEEHNIEEIAEIMKVSQSTVKVRLHRARKRLAKQLSNILRGEELTL